MKSWTQEIGGPNGNRTYDEKTWNVTHTIPEAKLMLYHMGIDYNMYDRNGSKIMTYSNFEHTYGDKYARDVLNTIVGLFKGKQTQSLRPDRYRVEMFKSIVDEFRRDFEDIQDNFKTNKKKERISTTIGFRNITMPNAVGGDEYSLKSIYFQMKDSAYKYTNVKIDYDGKGGAKYFVEGTITRYSLDRKWIEPHVTLNNKEIDRKTSEWYDSKGKKHKKKIIKYITEIVDHHGYWQYTATVTGTFKQCNWNWWQASWCLYPLVEGLL